MTNRQFSISLFIIWLCAFSLYLTASLLSFWLSVERQPIQTVIVVPGLVSIILAVLVGWLCIKANRQGMLIGLILAVLLFAIIKMRG